MSAMTDKGASLAARFWAKVNRDGDGCWEWRGSQDHSGYGRLSPPYPERRAHRYAWHLTNGPVPEGLNVCHRCDNPSCVRPDHLFVGTQEDNMRDARTKGRAVYTDPTTLRGRRTGSVDMVTDPSAYDELLAPLREELARIAATAEATDRCDRAGALVSAMERVIGEVVVVRDEAAQEILRRSPRTHAPTQVADLMHITKGGLKQKMDRWGIPAKQPA